MKTQLQPQRTATFTRRVDTCTPLFGSRATAQLNHHVVHNDIGQIMSESQRSGRHVFCLSRAFYLDTQVDFARDIAVGIKLGSDDLSSALAIAIQASVPFNFSSGINETKPHIKHNTLNSAR